MERANEEGADKLVMPGCVLYTQLGLDLPCRCWRGGQGRLGGRQAGAGEQTGGRGLRRGPGRGVAGLRALASG